MPEISRLSQNRLGLSLNSKYNLQLFCGFKHANGAVWTARSRIQYKQSNQSVIIIQGRRMSDSNEHEMFIKTPKQLIYVVIAAFIVPIVIIIMLAKYVATGDKPAAGSTAMTEEAIADRLKPVAKLEFVDANAPKVLKTGAEVYNLACAACHATGAAGAPKFGDKGQWAPRLGKGYETLWNNAVKGINAMPAKGGNPDLDDIEVARAVAHMTKEVGSNDTPPEPKAPAAAPADAPAAK